MIVSRHYDRTNGKGRRVREHPDAELERRLAQTPQVKSLPNLRGIGVVNAIGVSKATARPYVRRNTYLMSRKGRPIMADTAPYAEVLRDAGSRKQATVKRDDRQRTVQAQTRKRTDRDILMSLPTIHDPAA